MSSNATRALGLPASAGRRVVSSTIGLLGITGLLLGLRLPSPTA